jgi:hypothetical protein
MPDMRGAGQIPTPLPDNGGLAPSCGPVYAIDGSGLIADDLCSCGCTAYDERCDRWQRGERGASHPCCA